MGDGASAGTQEYEVLAELGSGGMGAVYLARALGLGGFERLVAIKRMHPDLLQYPVLLERFMDEARLTAHVRHANVVSVQRLGEDDVGRYLVLDYVEGANLDTLIAQSAETGERIPPPVALRITMDALAGLHAVHEAMDPSGQPLSILHRDVSPQNILVGRDGVARLTDFGIARSALSAQRTQKRQLLGKLLYLAPEYLQDDHFDRRLDVYSMGVTLWVALAGAEPWPNASHADVVQRVLSEGLPPLSRVGVRVAPQLEALLAKACARDPEQRFPTAKAMLEALDQIGRETGWLATHSEVAQVVEQFDGERLDQLRRYIASTYRGDAPRPPMDSGVRSPPPLSRQTGSSSSETRPDVGLDPLPLVTRLAAPEGTAGSSVAAAPRITAAGKLGLAVLVVLILGVVFTLGVMVGRGS
ncbi:MAG: serine/threonine-protein kinase [Polyangiaceae bacterium]